MTRDVVLVPGLWMPAAAMGLLARRLARTGYATHLFSYPGRAPHEANIERLARYARDTLQGRPAHFVGHSLGGVLILDTLNRHPEIPVASALLLGSPARGCLAGRRFARGRFGRWFLGASESCWRAREARWQRGEPLGVIAGTVPLGLGAALGDRLPGSNDGVVCVEETEVDGMAARALVREGHSVLIVSGTVGRLAERFLGQGRFA